MQKLRSIHRFVTIFIAAFLLFLGVTGAAIQAIDLQSIARGSPATNVNVQAMREAFDGPGDFVVRQAADYDAPALPARFNFAAGLTRLMRVAREKLGPAELTYAEFRMIGGAPVAQVGIGKGHARFDASTGTFLEQTLEDKRDDQSPESERNTFKRLHRMTTFGDWALYINIAVSLGLATLIATGLIIYFKLLQQRRKIKRPSPFWAAGGAWRSLHRSIAVVAAAVLCVVTLSGAWLAVESLGLSLYMANNPPGSHPRPKTEPIDDAQLPEMLRTGLAALAKSSPDAPVKVLRLRSYGGYAQAVSVTGGGDNRQRVFNAKTGEPMSLTESGYAPTPFPFGWQAHQTAKSIHRGDFFGLSGRMLDLLAGIALVYLSVSGIVMYVITWRKRRTSGRRGLLWV